MGYYTGSASYVDADREQLPKGGPKGSGAKGSGAKGSNPAADPVQPAANPTMDRLEGKMELLLERLPEQAAEDMAEQSREQSRAVDIQRSIPEQWVWTYSPPPDLVGPFHVCAYQKKFCEPNTRAVYWCHWNGNHNPKHSLMCENCALWFQSHLDGFMHV